ncbi:hypothetical protein [Nocardia inohanensis]|uniref:hypothetical protein n=1 Tax=Nocardia inohanensis TaxID=209246 RepID=UPI00082A0DF2|nr:hypothetical protein [Nocardia inohanensis]
MDSEKFVAVMTESTRLLQTGRVAEALTLLNAYDAALESPPPPKDYGWIHYYRFRAAFETKDYELALRLAEYGPARFPADVPAPVVGTMYSEAMEAAVQLGRPESAVVMADRSIELRRKQNQREEVLMAAMTAGTLLGRIGRYDLARKYSLLLVTEGEGFERYRAHGYRQLCDATAENPDPEVMAVLLSGREWLRGSESQEARAALAFIESFPALRERAEAVDRVAGVRFAPDQGPAAAPVTKQPPAAQCEAGELADGLLAAGQPGRAAEAYRALITDALGTGRPDLLIMGKSLLGLMQALIFDNRVREAFDVWVDQGPASKIGILALEQGQTSVHDLIGYRLVEAYLHSLSSGDKTAATQAVDTVMRGCVDYAFAHEPDVVARMLTNWRRHLTEIYDDAPPPAVFAQVEVAESRLGYTAPPGPLYWSQPSRWVIDWL